MRAECKKGLSRFFVDYVHRYRATSRLAQSVTSKKIEPSCAKTLNFETINIRLYVKRVHRFNAMKLLVTKMPGFPINSNENFSKCKTQQVKKYQVSRFYCTRITKGDFEGKRSTDETDWRKCLIFNCFSFLSNGTWRVTPCEHILPLSCQSHIFLGRPLRRR